MSTSAMIWFAVLLLLYSGPLITLQQDLGQGQLLTNCNPSVGNYTPDGQYGANLRNTLLPSLASNAATDNYTSYYTTVVGQGTNQIYGFAQCMSASSIDDCSACLNRSLTEITELCPTRVRADVRYENCIIRYSNSSFLSRLDTSRIVWFKNTNNATDPTLFSQQLGSLMRNMSRASDQSPSRFAAGSIQYTDLNNIYGMAQCTRDLSSTDCLSCLQQIFGLIDNSVGARIYFPSCSIRYEIYPFYPADGLTPPSPLPPSLPPNLTPTDGSPPTAQSGSDQTNSTRQGNSNNGTRNIIIGSVVGGISVLAVMIFLVWWVARRRRADRVVVEPRSETIDDESKPNFLFDLDEIRAATNNFSEENKLGQGGFGPVYKGTLGDGQQIAVKRLQASSSQGITELKNEVALLAKLQHRNLVKLMGCCLENQEKLLVYEFVMNSSLDKFLFDRVKKGDLKWEFRSKIIGGIARGLQYLHEDSRLRIIHRDLKASNILLDGAMNAKISDFGLAKIFGADQTQGNTSRIAGTFGYMSPEYAMHGLFSMKSDVYSFGVLVLEIVTGRSNSVYSESGDSIDLLSHVWRHWTNGSIPELIDEKLDGYPINEVVRCIHIGLLCVQENAAERPTMSNVAVMLSSESLTLSAPLHPAFCSVKSDNSSYSSPIQSETSRTNADIQSVYDASVSDLYPR